MNINEPAAACAYDYLLGGMHNFAADRQLAERILAAEPDARFMAHENRAFLGRAVRYLAEQGIRQFLDLGSGIPTLGNVHEIAQTVAPDARVVYVDMDPVAVACSESVLADNPRAAAIRADLRYPRFILHHPQVTELLDLGQPIAVLMIAVLHFVEGEDPGRIVGQIRDDVVAGSYLAVSHITSEHRPEQVARISELGVRAGIPSTARGRAEIEALFAGWDLVLPGVTWTAAWRPDDPEDIPVLDVQPQRANLLAGVGRKSAHPAEC